MTESTPQSAGATRIRLAESAADREAVYRFRYDLYVDGMKKQVPGADHAGRRLIEPLDATARIYVAEIERLPIATLRVNWSNAFTPEAPLSPALLELLDLDPFLGRWPDALSLSSRLMVTPDRRGSVVLNRLLAAAYADALSAGIEFDFCYVPPYLVEMYLQLGYRTYKPSVTDPHVGYLIPLVLPLRDWASMHAIGSPMLRLAERAGFDTGTPSPAVVWFHDHIGTEAAPSGARWRGPDDWERLARRLQPGADATPSLLTGLDADDLGRLLRSQVVLRCPAGERLVQRGDARDEMFLVLRGQLLVRLETDSRPLTTLGPGQVFGEMGMLTRTARSAFVDVAEDAEILIITRQALDRLIKVEPALAARLLFNLSCVLSARLMAANDRLRTDDA